MATDEEKLAGFSAMVLEIANRQRDDMTETLREEINLSIEKIERDFTRNANENMKKEIQRKSRENGEKLLKLETELKRKLILRREEIIKEIFDDVAERVNAFTQKEEYGAWLRKKAEQGVQELGGKNCVLHIMKKDAQYKDELESLTGSRAEISDDNFVGGVIVYSQNRCVDYSLKSIIEREQEIFLTNTDLSVG